ncbi:MAG: GNAT family N-acetyltransferase [Bacillota bacterium]
MHIRPAVEADYPRLVTIINQTHIRQFTLEEFRAELTHSAGQGPVCLLVTEVEGEIPGYGMLSRGPWLPPGGFYISVRVDPARSNQGVGSAILRALEEQAVAWGGSMAEVGVRDHRPDWLAFAEKRGYWLKEHFSNSELDLATFDPEPFRPMVTQAEGRGYRFVTMADLPVEEAQRRFYELDMECSQDEPDKGPDWQPIDYEEYRADAFAPDRYDPKGVVVALKDGEWAGVSGCHFPPGRQHAWVMFTGVRRPHRGHGLAQALKLLACEYVRSRGDYPMIATGNHVRNAPMLAVNQKFGFAPTPGSYILRKNL